MHVKAAPNGPTVDPNQDRYWLAGLLEGEGSFIKGPPSSPRCAIVQVAMTDEDVIAAVAHLLARAVYRWDPPEPRHKRVYITRIKGMAARAIMKTLYPVMSARRQRQIETALAAPHAARMRSLVRGSSCILGDRRPVRSRGLCRQHYNTWWKRKKRGRDPKYAAVDLLPPAAGPPLGPVMLDDEDAVAWLAGLLEGEGSFVNSGGYPRITVQMCDADVLERAAAIMASPRVWRRDVLRTARRGWSPMFETAVTGARAADWMRRVRPLMGLRRGSEIDATLAAYHPIRLVKAPAGCVVSGCEGPHRSRGLCHTHYMKWTRDLKAGKPQRVWPLR